MLHLRPVLELREPVGSLPACKILHVPEFRDGVVYQVSDVGSIKVIDHATLRQSIIISPELQTYFTPEKIEQVELDLQARKQREITRQRKLLSQARQQKICDRQLKNLEIENSEYHTILGKRITSQR